MRWVVVVGEMVTEVVDRRSLVVELAIRGSRDWARGLASKSSITIDTTFHNVRSDGANKLSIVISRIM